MLSAMPFASGTILQYTFLAVFGYILAGAPFLSLLAGPSGGVVNHFSFDQADNLVVPEPDLNCEEYGYKVHLLVREPLVAYIEGFLTNEEAEHVVKMRWVYLTLLLIGPYLEVKD